MEKPALSSNELPVKVLVVDDHPNTAVMMARALAQLGPQVKVVSATSGREALAQVQEGAADILITDMIMPEMTGLELIEQLHNHPSGRPTYSFLMTAYDVPGLKITARRLKVKEVIVKPIHPERICRIVREAVAEIHQSKPSTKEPVSQKTFKILIADDQPDNRALLARYLTYEGYGHIQSGDGLETLEKVRSEMPDLILLDVNMPFKDGFAVLEEIRADPITQHIPVIILTAARLDPAEIQSGLNMGADDYVTKPFDRLELLARIRTKLRVKEAEDVIRRRNRELNFLPEIGKELGARLNIDELSELVLRRTVETMGAMVGHILLLNQRSPIHKEYHISAEVQAPETQLPPLNQLLEQIKATRESILIKNTHADELWQTSSTDPVHSAIIVPLFGRLDLIGVLILVHEQVDYFKEDHQLLLQAITGQAAIAMENTRLYANMAQEQQKLSAILQSAADAIIMFDVDGCLSMLNPAARSLFAGETVQIGLPLARGTGHDTLIEALEEAYTSGRTYAREMDWRDNRVFNTLFTPIAEGGCVVVLHDVTHFKELEKVKNSFVATASHDLRNPITTIKGYSQLLKSAGPLNEHQADFIRRIQNAAEHMRELVENVLDLAKMDLGAEKKHELLDVTAILHEMAEEFRPQAEGKGQILRFEHTGSSSPVMGDALKLRQALRNLIGNAIKYTPEIGTVMLTLEQEPELAKIHIRDTGYGIPAEDLPHLFKRFYRVRNNGHDIEGNGLGLAIVKGIAEEHGGDVTVTSEIGKGSCFTLSLPLHQDRSELYQSMKEGRYE